MADTATIPTLLQLAPSRFDNISPAEQKLFEAATNGKDADCTSLSEKDRVIRGDLLSWLCKNRDASAQVTYRGVSIVGAQIEGELNLKWAKISFPLQARMCVFKEAIILENSHLVALIFLDTSIKDLRAEDVIVERSVILRDGFKAEGAVNFVGATIGGHFECDGGQFDFKGNAPALDANGVKVEGSVSLRTGFKAEGAVNFVGATIGGFLLCDGGQFNFKGDAPALGANRVKVEGSVSLRTGFKAEGAVNFVGAYVGRYFQWYGIQSPENSILDLRFARVGTLLNEQASRLTAGKLRVDGFVYDQIDDDASPNAEAQLSWLDRQPRNRFLSQPYEQLAAVLGKMGLEEDERKVMIAKNKNKAAHLHWRPAWLWYGLLGKLIGYVYRPWRAFIISLILIGIGWLVFQLGYHSNLFIPTGDKAYVVEKDGTRRLKNGMPQISEDYPKFNAFVYSMESFVPLVKMGISDRWTPNAHRGTSLRLGIATLPRTGSLLRYYLWFHMITGWVLSALWVGGITGLVKT